MRVVDLPRNLIHADVVDVDVGEEKANAIRRFGGVGGVERRRVELLVRRVHPVDRFRLHVKIDGPDGRFDVDG